MSDPFLSIYEKQRHLTLRENSFRIRKKHVLLLVALAIMSCVPIAFLRNNLERSLTLATATQASKAEHDIHLHGCRYGIAMGADLNGTMGLLALINSIIQNYQPYDNDSNLCIFVFSTQQDHTDRKRIIDCAIESRLDHNVQQVAIIHKIIDKENWKPRIYGYHEAEKIGMEYKWFRYYLTPNDVDGLTRIIYLDTDIIVQGNIAELFEWNMNEHIVAATSYWEPLRNHLCHNHRLSDIKMQTGKVGFFGTKTSTPFETLNHISTGLLLIDLEKMARQQILKRWTKLLDLHEGEECLWLDAYSGDTAFTIAIKNDVEKLPQEWNVGNLGTPAKYRLIGGCERAKVLHWNGEAKPYTNVGRTSALCSDYFDKYDMAPVLRQENPECQTFQS